MMKAVVIDQFGAEPVLRSVDRTFPGHGEVLVRVEASGVNPLDTKIVADADLLALKPVRLSMAQAAALPLAVITAWEGLVDRAAVGPGRLVLVHGGAGGVGHVAVQLARSRGAAVFATGTGRSLAVIRALGATPIDYRVTPVETYVASATGGAGFDVIFDTIGGQTLDASFAAHQAVRTGSARGKVVVRVGARSAQQPGHDNQPHQAHRKEQ